MFVHALASSSPIPTPSPRPNCTPRLPPGSDTPACAALSPSPSIRRGPPSLPAARHPQPDPIRIQLQALVAYLEGGGPMTPLTPLPRPPVLLPPPPAAATAPRRSSSRRRHHHLGAWRYTGTTRRRQQRMAPAAHHHDHHDASSVAALARRRRASARFAVFFIDERQRVTLRDDASVADIRLMAGRAGARIWEAELTSQFRCNGSDSYLSWLDDVLGIKPAEDRA
ncbi:MAG: DUF2075 domain-containing protein [Coriobacteriia bacterium]|nr:DUF2075 domain-containing protein [Coriobacteriia bacterium]